MRTPGELVASVRHLASLPASFQRVKQVLDDPRGSGTQLAELIACDPGMSAAVLRVVNSAYFGIPGGVETVSHALWVLGMQRVHDIVLATSLATTFRGIPAAQMDMERYWRASVLRSVAARGAARLHGITDLERLLVEGLLADIGHLVMYLMIPALAEQARRVAAAESRPLEAVERSLIGYDAAAVGASLIRTWNLPDTFAVAIGAQHHPATAGQRPLEASLLNVANAIVLAVERNLNGDEMRALVAPTVAEVVDFPLEALTDIRAEAVANIDAAMSMFFPGLANAA